MSSDESHDNPLVLLTKQHPASSENAGFCIHLHSIVLMKFPMRRVGKTCVNCYESSSTEFETNKCEYYIDN